jgi:hypothetical protein
MPVPVISGDQPERGDQHWRAWFRRRLRIRQVRIRRGVQQDVPGRVIRIGTECEDLTFVIDGDRIHMSQEASTKLLSC